MAKRQYVKSGGAAKTSDKYKQRSKQKKGRKSLKSKGKAGGASRYDLEEKK